MAINFYDYVSKYDFVPFAELLNSDDFKVLSKSKTSLISTALKDSYKELSDTKIEFTPESLKKEKVILKFKLQKAHQYASDPDGYLRYKLSTIKGHAFVTNHNKPEVEHDLGIKKYGDIVEIVFSKNLMDTVQFIDFYFKDNSEDWLDLKGSMPDKWEHCGRVSIGAGSACYCNRDFTEEEIKKIVKELRDNTFYNEKSISYYHSDKLFHRNSQTKEEYKTEELPINDRSYKKLTEVLNAVFKKHHIDKCINKVTFLAQMYIETAYFTATIELTHQKKEYEPYRGRGFIQLTHKGNQDKRTLNAVSYLGYKLYSNIDVITTPSKISTSLEISGDSAGWFWEKGVRKFDGSVINLNTKCGKEESEFREVTRLIKGAATEFGERKEAFYALLKIFNYEDCINKK
ncbi:hypothetical protein [Flavobacterium hungaricum]|uniref:Glycoside hydrolase family 19 catalytic domain-containing protein n=1 Tax=Flavobacterium hungaricum TaxID=2082725 RepID=A0ABR9TP36_9FLAO|nr:hypothetical protein [Flavobacterium hungaricum]MBE8726784.1 hypothetical protein [Flavobacterium hungaricum]